LLQPRGAFFPNDQTEKPAIDVFRALQATGSKRYNQPMASIEYVVESYADYLRGLNQKQWQAFQKRRMNAPESALAEAMVFRVLQFCKVGPVVADAPGGGGPDFLCLYEKPDAFMVEATSPTPDRVTKVSSIPNRVPEDMEGGPFGLLTAQIDETATKKLYQFKDIGKPGILAIASSHFGSHILLDSQSAMYALVSQPFWVAGTEGVSTDLKYSLFVRGEGNDIVAKNKEISAVLLIAVGADRSYVSGALHPDPKHPFDSKALWEIPFAYLKDWPVEKNRLRATWTLGESPEPLQVSHAAIR
jgi:hypothetical protein